MILRREKLDDKFQFKVVCPTIPTITEKLVKSLGKVFCSSLSIHPGDLVRFEWFAESDHSGLLGRLK